MLSINREPQPERTAPFKAVTQFLTVAQVARRWSVSEDLVRRRYRNNKHVLKLGAVKPRTRGWVMLRIPEWLVLEDEEKLKTRIP